MPNRILKESVCCSENIDSLTWFQEAFFYRLIVNCDDYGRMDARPKVLASKLFPLKDIRINQIVDALHALSSAELVVLYEKDGHPFLQMKTWDRHQTIRAKKSKFPAPDDDCKQLNADEINCKQMKSDESKCPRNPIQSNTNTIQSESESKTRPQARETVKDEDLAFAAFWELYPNKVAKQDALKAWKKLKPDSELLVKIMAGLRKWIDSDEWKRDGGRFIPHPSTWINGRRWEDEVRKGQVSAVKKVIAQDFEQRDYSEVTQDSMSKLAAEIKAAREAGII